MLIKCNDTYFLKKKNQRLQIAFNGNSKYVIRRKAFTFLKRTVYLNSKRRKIINIWLICTYIKPLPTFCCQQLARSTNFNHNAHYNISENKFHPDLTLWLYKPKTFCFSFLIMYSARKIVLPYGRMYEFFFFFMENHIYFIFFLNNYKKNLKKIINFLFFIIFLIFF